MSFDAWWEENGNAERFGSDFDNEDIASAAWDAATKEAALKAGKGWHWVYGPPTNRECGRINWVSPAGQVAATVFLNNNKGRGYPWYVWDENGTGGENSMEPTADAAVIEAEGAARKWGKHGLKPAP